MTIEQTVSAPQKHVLKSTSPINLFLGGVGSGKTHLLGIKTYQLIRRFPQCRGFIGANTYLQLEQSTLFRIREYWKSIGITEFDKDARPHGQYVINKKPPAHFNTENHSFDSYYGIISFINGCVVFVGSLERSESHEGKEMAWAVLDETKDTEESDVKEIIIARIRQKGMYIVNGLLSDKGSQEQQYNPLFIATSPAKVDWINSWFGLDNYIDEISKRIYAKDDYFSKQHEDKFITISSTWHNVHNVGENYIRNVLDNNTEERGKALIYANPFVTTGGEFYSSFDRLKHVDSVKYDPELSIHISFDQNTVPYNSASIWQGRRDSDLWDLRAIGEIALVNPRNSTEDVCDEFICRYPNHSAGLFYYGDASGRNRSTMSSQFKHHYEIIEYKLRKYINNSSDRTLASNPPVVARRDFANRMFEGKLPVRITIDEGCHYLISDLMYCKQAIDGGKDKHVVTDKETGERYQKYGHLGDCFTGDTLVLTDKGEKAMRLIEIGDMVLTRNGYRRVIAKQHKGIKIVNTYKIGEREITCTPEHKIYANDDFIMVSTLIDMNINCIFARKESWIEKLLSWMGINSTDTHNQRNHQIETISKDGLNFQASGKKHPYIVMFGKSIIKRYRRDLWCIISMVTSLTIRLKILILLAVQNIYDFIIVNTRRSIKIEAPVGLLSLQYQRQLSGINQRRGFSGIEKTLIDLFTQKNILKPVSAAETSLNLISDQNRFGVQGDASLNIKQEKTGKKKNITKRDIARHAGNHLASINGIRISSAHVPVRKIGASKRRFVYDITVEQDHEFFANGVLVHNCFEYLIVEMFKTYFDEKR